MRLRRSFVTQTSSYCAKSIEPILTALPPICLTGTKPPISIDDELDATTTVPASGSYAWHVNQSTRPFVGAAGGTEAYDLTCESADGTVLEHHSLVIARGEDVTLNLGCGAGATTLADGTKLAPCRAGRRPGQGPGTDGRRHPGGLHGGTEARQAARHQQRSRRQVRRLHERATRLGTVAGSKAAQRRCDARFGV